MAGVKREELTPGSSVAVFVYQRWRMGRVIRLTPTRARVEYLTPRGAKVKHEAWFYISALRPTPPASEARRRG